MFFLFSIFFLGSALQTQMQEDTKKQIQKIEQNLLDLKEQKKQHEKKKSLHESKARDRQFDREYFLECRREYLLAEKEKDKIQIIDLKIKELCSEKKELLSDLH